jgi:hypothetical protein
MWLDGTASRSESKGSAQQIYSLAQLMRPADLLRLSTDKAKVADRASFVDEPYRARRDLQAFTRQG